MEAKWRAEAKARQRRALPDGPTVVSGRGAYGSGGLGQHLADLVESLREVGRLDSYLTPRAARRDAGEVGIEVNMLRGLHAAMSLPPMRFSPGYRVLFGNVSFDYAASRRLPGLSASHLLAFNGQALRQIAIARHLGYESVGLVSANAHLVHEAREFEKAWRQYPIEKPWAAQNVRRNLAEYRAADYVHVSSRYVWESFVNEGFPEDRLRLFPLVPSERFRPRPHPPTVSTFDIVFVGSLAVHKGVPLLIDAVKGLPHRDLRLVLVGSWGTRGMRRHIEAACHEDPRVKVCPGDPLPRLQQAGVCVHPSFGEGFGYGPGEALATGVPLIASRNSGVVGESIGDPGLCQVVPTGDQDALRDAIDAAYRGQFVGG